MFYRHLFNVRLCTNITILYVYYCNSSPVNFQRILDN